MDKKYYASIYQEQQIKLEISRIKKRFFNTIFGLIALIAIICLMVIWIIYLVGSDDRPIWLIILFSIILLFSVSLLPIGVKDILKTRFRLLTIKHQQVFVEPEEMYPPLRENKPE